MSTENLVKYVRIHPFLRLGASYRSAGAKSEQRHTHMSSLALARPMLGLTDTVTGSRVAACDPDAGFAADDCDPPIVYAVWQSASAAVSRLRRGRHAVALRGGGRSSRNSYGRSYK